MSSPTLTTAEAAQRLGVTPGRICQLARAGKLEGERRGRDWLVDEDSVVEYAATRKPPGWPRRQEGANE
jgi:excisionase family DNA binding protein